MIDAITDACIQALKTDGSHHKQFWLEQILLMSLGMNYKKREELHREYEWEHGIKP